MLWPPLHIGHTSFLDSLAVCLVLPLSAAARTEVAKLLTGASLLKGLVASVVLFSSSLGLRARSDVIGLQFLEKPTKLCEGRIGVVFLT